MRAKDKTGDNLKVLKQASQEADIPEYKMRDIVDCFFTVVVKDIELGEYRGSFCRNLGKIVVKPKRLEYINKLKSNGKNIRVNRRESGDKPFISNDSRTKETLG